MADRFDIQMFGRDVEEVARLVRAEDVFSFMNRQVSAPVSCVAVVWGGAGQPTVVPAGGAIESQGARELLFVRDVPFSLAYQLDGLTSKDGFACSASVQLSVQVVPDRAELVAFRRSLLGSGNEVRKADLRRHCEEAVRAATAGFAKERDAADLVSAQTWTAFDDELAKAFKPVGFESGLALGPDPRVQFASRAFADSQRAEEAADRRRKRQEQEEEHREAAAKAREKHLENLGSLLGQLKRMSGDKPGVAVADLIKTFDPAQRGALYEGLAARQGPRVRTEAILVVAGDELLRFDPANLEKPTERRNLSSEIGSLRSVRVGREGPRPVVLVGARRGVHLVASCDDPPRTFAIKTDGDLRGGVNAAAIAGEHLYATHSEVGLVRWPLSRQDVHEPCLTEITEGARAVRDVQTDEAGRLWLSVDNILVCWRPDEASPSVLLSAAEMITTVCIAGGDAYVGLEDGAIVAWDAAAVGEMRTIRSATGSAIRSLDWTLGGGVPRLLIADKRPLLTLQVLGDAYLGEYRCGQKLRWGLAADDWIVGVNDRRDQLFTWRFETPQLPVAGISVGRLCGRSIQDVVLLPVRSVGDAGG